MLKPISINDFINENGVELFDQKKLYIQIIPDVKDPKIN